MVQIGKDCKRRNLSLSWGEQQKEKKEQKTLDNWDEEEE